MIEQIREFERESGLEIYGLGAKREQWVDTMQRFAELVIKDVIKQAEEANIKARQDADKTVAEAEEALRSAKDKQQEATVVIDQQTDDKIDKIKRKKQRNKFHSQKNQNIIKQTKN